MFPPLTGAGEVWTLRIQGEKRNTWDICFLESNISAHSLLDNRMVNKKSVKPLSETNFSILSYYYGALNQNAAKLIPNWYILTS